MPIADNFAHPVSEIISHFLTISFNGRYGKSIKKQDLSLNLFSYFTKFGIFQVRFIFWKNARAVVDIVFDGKNSKIDNWFQQKNVIKINAGPNVLRKTTYNYWSVMGHSANHVQRHFFINHNYGGCNVDNGLIVVVDK